MKLALVGTGRMGQAVEALAMERGHTITTRFDSARPLAGHADALEGADVAVDFSLPDVALDHIERYCRRGQPAVIGTTGWYDAMDQVRAWVESREATLLYAPNFSVGVALLRRALQALTPLVDALPDYDAYVHEIHHTGKADSPSGTARMLGEILLEGLERKDQLETETQYGPIAPEALHVTSTRAGTVFGQHTVGLDGPFDQLHLTHEAKDREGFAFGALRAAEWLVDQLPGLYTLDDVLVKQDA